MDALLRAYNDGVDVINLSLGGLNGFSQDPLSLVANRIAQKGVVVVASGACTLQWDKWEGCPLITGRQRQRKWSSSPASGGHVIAMGSVDKLVTGLSFLVFF